MASLTLDELLDATGISDMAGTELEKKAASVPTNFSKLADRCRQAAESPPETSNDLVEKTAAVEIIRRTLSEIREIEGPPEAEKTAQQEPADQAVFIRAAIEEGHTPEDIAQFLEKQAFLGVGRTLRTAKAALGSRRSAKTTFKALSREGRSNREWTNLLSRYAGASDMEKTKLVRSMYKELGPDDASALLAHSAAKRYKTLPVVKELFPKGPTAPPVPGAAKETFEQQALKKGKELGKKYWKPAAMVGGGAVAGKQLGGGGGNKPPGAGAGTGKNVNIIQ